MLTKQEMFDKAVIGLRSQGFAQCINDAGACRYVGNYQAERVMHCAYGWVDPNQGNNAGSVWDLMHGNATNAYGETRDIGPVALEIRLLDSVFAKTDIYTFLGELQAAHDTVTGDDAAEQMVANLKCVAKQFNLTWPE